MELLPRRFEDQKTHTPAKYFHKQFGVTSREIGHAIVDPLLPNSTRCSSGPNKMTSAPTKRTTSANSPMALP